MTVTRVEPIDSVDVSGEDDSVTELIEHLAELCRSGKMTPCVGKFAAAVAVRFARGNLNEWAQYGADCAYAKASPRLGLAFERLLESS